MVTPPCSRPTQRDHDARVGRAQRVAPALNAPVRSLEMLDLQLAAGATEIYVGLASDALNVLTFNAHAKTRDEQPTQVSSLAMLGDLVADAHSRGVQVHFSANVQYLPTALHSAYVAHVEAAIERGVDTVIVANLGLMRLLRQSRISIPLIAAGYMGVTTTALARYLHGALGVTRVVLPHAMTLDEIAAFTALPGLEIEVQVQTGAGMSCGRCMLFDSPVKPEIGLGCRAGYTVKAPDGSVRHGSQFLDGSTDCALCNVGDLIDVGVHALKIPGRESPNVRTNAKITQMYRKAINDALADKPLDVTIQEIDRVELMWQMNWVPRFCENLRCRFRETPTTQSYI